MGDTMREEEEKPEVGERGLVPTLEHGGPRRPGDSDYDCDDVWIP